MISQDVKNALLQSIDDLVARIMAQAGMKEGEVTTLIDNLFADADEAIDTNIGNKIISPTTAALAALEVLKGNIGNAPDELNSIEKLAAALPVMQEAIDGAMADLSTSLNRDLAGLMEGFWMLMQNLTIRGIMGALDYTDLQRDTLGVLSTDWDVLRTLPPGTYNVITLASNLGIPELSSTIAGVHCDEEVRVKVTHLIKPLGVIHHVKVVQSTRGEFELRLFLDDPTQELNNRTNVWSVPPDSPLKVAPTDNLWYMTDKGTLDTIEALERISSEQSPEVPTLGTKAHYHHTLVGVAGRENIEGIFLHIGNFGRTVSEWAVFTNCYPSSLRGSDDPAKLAAIGCNVMDSGVVIDLAANGKTRTNYEYKIDILNSVGVTHHYRANSPDINPRITNSDPDVWTKDDFIFGVVPKCDFISPPGLYYGEVTFRVSFRDVSTGKIYSKVVTLAQTLDTRATQIPVGRYTIGTWDQCPYYRKGIPTPNVGTENCLRATNNEIQTFVNVSKSVRMLRNSVPYGILPTFDENSGLFKTGVGSVVEVRFGCSEFLNSQSDPVNWTSNYDVRLELSHGGVTRGFMVMATSPGLSPELFEIVDGVLSTVSNYDVAYEYYNGDNRQQGFMMQCGKNGTNPFASHLEMLFPASLATIEANDVGFVPGEPWYAHSGQLGIKFFVIPKENSSAKGFAFTSEAIVDFDN